jgi:transposase-like protein
MKKSRFSEEQIVAILKQQEAGAKTADVCRKHGISDVTFYKWTSVIGWVRAGVRHWEQSETPSLGYDACGTPRNRRSTRHTEQRQSARALTRSRGS